MARGGVGNPQIIRFEASPLSIQPGQQSTLSWTTTGATQVSISGVGSVTPNGSTTVSPAQTTTYTLTATSADGKSVTAPITITVATGTVPQVVVFVATPHHHRCRQLYQAVLAGDGRDQHHDHAGRRQQSECERLRHGQPDRHHHLHAHRDQRDGPDSGQRDGQRRRGEDHVVHRRPGDLDGRGQPGYSRWTTQNATSVVLIGSELGPQTLPANGSLVVSPITNSIYTLTAYGPGGQTVSVTISVFVR